MVGPTTGKARPPTVASVCDNLIKKAKNSVKQRTTITLPAASAAPLHFHFVFLFFSLQLLNVLWLPSERIKLYIKRKRDRKGVRSYLR